MPGLFDELDDFIESGGTEEFKIIPDEKMRKAVEELRRERSAIDELPPLGSDNRIFFMSFGSGSSGNCSYVGDRHSGFLIDAGVDAKKVTEGLKANGISMDSVKGICLTHDHGDHICNVYALLRNHRHLRVYCTPKTLTGILRRHNVSRRIKDYHVAIYKEFPFKIDNFEITAFDVMHDGADNSGFYISCEDCRLAVATDLGCISERVDHYMRLANNIVIEANYDLDMLRYGRYPEYLKARIEASNGHLDNKVTAKFISDIYSSSLRHIFLCHLSHDNNTPYKALDAVSEALHRAGVENIGDGSISLFTPDSSSAPSIHLIALPRFDRTPLYSL